MCSMGTPKRGTKLELATSPLPSRGPTSGWNCYVRPAFSGVPTTWDKIRIGYLLPSLGPTSGRNCYVTPAFSGVPRIGDKIRIGYLMPTFSRARKWAELPCNPCVLGGPQNTGKKLELAPTPLPSRGPTSGWDCYVTPAFSGVPRTGDKNRIGYLTPAFSGTTSRWNCYVTPAFSGPK